jgi:hypothetical protein
MGGNCSKTCSFLLPSSRKRAGGSFAWAHFGGKAPGDLRGDEVEAMQAGAAGVAGG